MIDVLSAAVLAAAGIGFVLGRYSAPRFTAPSWRWSRQPPKMVPSKLFHGGLVPEAPPMPGMAQLVMPFMDDAARLLSAHIATPTDAEVALRRARLNLAEAEHGIETIRTEGAARRAQKETSK